jgi:AcrR family transcriptional regulator
MPKPLSTRPRHSSGPSRGELRRERLLQTLEELLADRSFASIEIADITQAAGVSRSAFYFYFPSKAAAVGATLGTVFGEIGNVIGTWVDLGENVEDHRKHVFDSMDKVVGIWRQHAYLMAAMFDAVATDEEVRTMFDGHIERFVRDCAERIRVEREAGQALDGPDPEALARVLVGMNVKALERDMRNIASGESAEEGLPRILAVVWDRLLYGA